MNIDPALPKPLRRLYAEIPDANCKGLCQAYCAAVPCSGLELQQAFRAAGTEHRDSKPGSACHYLTVEGRCAIYASRPLVCRLFGSVSDPRMVCPHGCRPKGGPLSSKKEGELLRRLVEIDPTVRSLDPIIDGVLVLAGKG